jgi:hypothetical protein
MATAGTARTIALLARNSPKYYHRDGLLIEGMVRACEDRD